MSKTDEELVAFSDRLLHDLQMFFRAGRSLVKAQIGFGRPAAWEVETALIESFALHTRALTDFYFTRKRHRDRPQDAFALDFFPTNEWSRRADEPGPWLSQLRLRATKGVTSSVDRFGEQIGHLNYRALPLSDYARGWPTVQVTRELGTTTRVFVESVSDARVSDVFKSLAWREVPVVSRLAHPIQAMAIWTPPVTPKNLAS